MTQVDSNRDSEGYGERIYKFVNYPDIYVAYDYYYTSYNGSDYDESVAYHVEPVQVIKTEYHSVSKEK